MEGEIVNRYRVYQKRKEIDSIGDRERGQVCVEFTWDERVGK